MRDVIRRHGAAVVPRILSGVAAGATFDNAFIAATGTTVRGATRLFWRSSGGWEEWITFIASPFTLWTLITSLALAAIWRHRLRRAERRRRWEAEEALDADLVGRTPAGLSGALSSRTHSLKPRTAPPLTLRPGRAAAGRSGYQGSSPSSRAGLRRIMVSISAR